MLSQAEIDALLNGAIEIDSPDSDERINLADILGEKPAAQNPKTEGRKVQSYNFWSPDRFSKEQMRAVELIHEDLAERLTASLPSFLRTNLRPRVVHTEQGRFHDFLKDLPPSSLFHIITLAPLPGQMVMTISPDVSYTILELRLGGRSERRQHNRGLTEIDQLLLRGMVEHMLNDFKAAWNRLVVVEPGLDDSTVNYHWVQMVMGNERVMLVAFEVTVQSVTGTMNVYIPFTMLKPIASLLNPHIFIAGQKEKEGSQSEQRTAVDNLSAVTIPTRVLLGSASVPFGSLVDIQPGEIIKLDRGIHQEVMIQIADRVRFTGRVGKNGEHLAVQITGLVDQK